MGTQGRLRDVGFSHHALYMLARYWKPLKTRVMFHVASLPEHDAIEWLRMARDAVCHGLRLAWLLDSLQ